MYSIPLITLEDLYFRYSYGSVLILFPDRFSIACKRGPSDENVTDFTVLAKKLEIEHIESETSNISQ